MMEDDDLRQRAFENALDIARSYGERPDLNKVFKEAEKIFNYVKNGSVPEVG